MASRSKFPSWQMVVFCVGCCYCRTVCLCLSHSLQNPFAMMPCGTQGHPISNRNGVCLGFFCSCCTANSVGVICFISSFVFVGIFFFFDLFIWQSYGLLIYYQSHVRLWCVILSGSDCSSIPVHDAIKQHSSTGRFRPIPLKFVNLSKSKASFSFMLY